MKSWFAPRYHFKEEASPTCFNLAFHLQQHAWRSSRFPWRAKLTEQHFLFDEEAAQCLEYKHQLAELTAAYCPQIHPETYLIHDNNWSNVLSHIAETYYTNGHKIADKIDHLTWILKPSLLNNGQHIKLFQYLSDIEYHYLSSNRVGGAHVLQRYLAPHLLNEKKYSIRLFVVLTNYAGVYLYRDGYFNEAIHPYKAEDVSDLRSHLTNEHLHDPEVNVIQHPTKDWALFASLYPQLKDLVQAVIEALMQQFPQAFIAKPQRAMALFGFDFMVDASGRAWLLEANHGPCFPCAREHPLQTTVYDLFWQALIRNFILPIKEKCPLNFIQRADFESIS